MDLKQLTDEQLEQEDAAGKVHGSRSCYQYRLGCRCDRCREAKRRRNQKDQQSLRDRDPSYFRRQARRQVNYNRAKQGLPPRYSEDGSEVLDPPPYRTLGTLPTPPTKPNPKATGWDGSPVEHLATKPKGPSVKPLASHNPDAVVKLDQPSRKRP